MKLDVNVLRYLGKDEFRVLTAVEMGQKNHEIVPATLVDTIAGLKHGGAFKCLKTLLRHKLVHHDGQKYDGYRLTTLGYDFLAIKTLVNRGVIATLGRQIGVGKESDVYEVADDEGRVMAMKLHRLGRTSFRAVKSKRDYVKRGSHYSWLYLSRLAALKEYAFMKALGDAGLPVPEAIECNRHAVLMTLIDGCPLVQVRKLLNPGKIYNALMDLLERLASLGLVHCDYNEFNILINNNEELTLIDFPQMVSVSHANAEELYERDMDGVNKFFARKIGYLPEEDPENVGRRERLSFEEAVAQGGVTIDEVLRASGFKKEHQDALDRFIISKTEEESDEEGSQGDEDDDEEDVESSREEESEEEEEDIPAEESVRRKVDDLDLDDADTNEADVTDSDGSMDDIDDEGPSTTGTATTTVNITAPNARKVQRRVNDQQRQAARRASLAKASRNASKSKNKGRKKGESHNFTSGGGGGSIWG